MHLYFNKHPVLAILLHDFVINGRAKILLKKTPNVVVNDAISSKVSTLHPKPNTLLDIYRENLFPQQPSTSTRKNFCVCFFCFILYKHYLVTVCRFQFGKAFGRRSPLSLSRLLASSVRLQALPIAGGVVSHDAGFQGSQDALAHAGWVSPVLPGPAPSQGLFVGAAAQTLFPPPLPQPSVLLRRKNDGALSAWSGGRLGRLSAHVLVPGLSWLGGGWLFPFGFSHGGGY